MANCSTSRPGVVKESPRSRRAPALRRSPIGHAKEWPPRTAASQPLVPVLASPYNSSTGYTLDAGAQRLVFGRTLSSCGARRVRNRVVSRPLMGRQGRHRPAGYEGIPRARSLTGRFRSPRSAPPRYHGQRHSTHGDSPPSCRTFLSLLTGVAVGAGVRWAAGAGRGAHRRAAYDPVQTQTQRSCRNQDIATACNSVRKMPSSACTRRTYRDASAR